MWNDSFELHLFSLPASKEIEEKELHKLKEQATTHGCAKAGKKTNTRSSRADS